MVSFLGAFGIKVNEAPAYFSQTNALWLLYRFPKSKHSLQGKLFVPPTRSSTELKKYWMSSLLVLLLDLSISILMDEMQGVSQLGLFLLLSRFNTSSHKNSEAEIFQTFESPWCCYPAPSWCHVPGCLTHLICTYLADWSESTTF